MGFPCVPLAAMVMEHLKACGARYVIGVGLVAAIKSDMRIGTLVLSTRAIRGEGTSYYYLPEDADAVPDSDVIHALERACDNLGKECVKGAIYTTDSIHRETKALIKALRERGIIMI